MQVPLLVVPLSTNTTSARNTNVITENHMDMVTIVQVTDMAIVMDTRKDMAIKKDMAIDMVSVIAVTGRAVTYVIGSAISLFYAKSNSLKINTRSF